MGDVIPIRRDEHVELNEQERVALSDPSWIDSYAQLLPLERLAQLRRQIEDDEAPAGLQVAAKVVAVLAGCLYAPGPNFVPDPSVFLGRLPEMLADQPAKALWAAVWEVRRTCKYIPPAATVLAICEDVRRPQRQMLRAIQAMEEEHRRRRQAAARSEDTRKAALEAYLGRLQEQARRHLGDDGPLPGDVELAGGLSMALVCRAGKHVSWRSALANGEHWAAKYCRQLALAARVKRALEQGRVSSDDALATAKLISTDETNARRQVDDLEGRAASPLGAQPSESFWRAVWKIASACGLDAPVFPEDAATAAINSLKHLTGLAELADTRAVLDRQVQDEWARRHG
jgi:hypothetical protein